MGKVKERERGEGGSGSMFNNTLLTKAVHIEYMQFAREVSEATLPLLQSEAICLNQIPDEQMRELPDGKAEIFVVLPDEGMTRISFTLEAGDWAWKDGCDGN